MADDPELDAAKLRAACALLRELAVRAIEQARGEVLEAEADALAAIERLEAARASLLTWVEAGERAAEYSMQAADEAVAIRLRLEAERRTVRVEARFARFPSIDPDTDPHRESEDTP